LLSYILVSTTKRAKPEDRYKEREIKRPREIWKERKKERKEERKKGRYSEHDSHIQ
jgi:hypothetical protein